MRHANHGHPRAAGSWQPATLYHTSPNIHAIVAARLGIDQTQQHTQLDPHAVTTISDPRESAERREQAAAQQP